MSIEIDMVRVVAVPSVLQSAFLAPPAWTRLEPQSISGDPTPGLEARVHDPLWLLLRQWQLAEFEGEDAGTPLIVHVNTKTQPVTSWQPGDPASNRPARPITPGSPLDPLIENEPPVPDVGRRQRAEAGAYLVELLADAGFDARATLVAACPWPADPSAEQLPPGLRLITTATPDGNAAAEQIEAGTPPWLNGASANVKAAAARWLEWFRANVAPPARDAADDSWIPERLEYRFSAQVGSGNDEVTLRAPLHEGGEIDWFTFDAEREIARPSGNVRPGGDRAEFNVMATPLRFVGMPSDRYWQFEDGQVNLGRLDAQPHDLARLCVAEFAMIYGNDWLVVPLNVQAGSFTTVTEVAYTDTFGERTEVAAPDSNSLMTARPFRMFEMSVQGTKNASVPGLLVAPTALGTLEGRALEEVVFLRDETANMAWAVERTVQSSSGDPRSRDDEERLVNAVEDLQPGAELQYLLQTEVPRHWIPFVPISIGTGTIALRKGTLADADLAQGILLRPIPLTIRDEEIPREGVQVRRIPALARDAHGRYLRWITRRTRIGRGEGSSGLSFDGAYRQ
jgi:hypothetical protein